MSQTPPILDPWKLVWGQPYIDCQTLAAAIEQDLERDDDPDVRTRLLVRDAAVAMRSFWGPSAVRSLAHEQSREPADPHDPPRRPGKGRIHHHPEYDLWTQSIALNCEQILEMLGQSIHGPIDVYIAGSIPTLIKSLTARPTTDIDFVDEVPGGDPPPASYPSQDTVPVRSDAGSRSVPLPSGQLERPTAMARRVRRAYAFIWSTNMTSS